jgi:hypothetical protein
MKTFLAYLTFAALLALCYVEKINAEAARSQVRGYAGGHQPQDEVLARAQLRTAAHGRE